MSSRQSCEGTRSPRLPHLLWNKEEKQTQGTDSRLFLDIGLETVRKETKAHPCDRDAKWTNRRKAQTFELVSQRKKPNIFNHSHFDTIFACYENVPSICLTEKQPRTWEKENKKQKAPKRHKHGFVKPGGYACK